MNRLLVLVVALFFAVAVTAQNETTPITVEKSKDKVKIDGFVYYVHIVKAHETLYSISKAYNVSQSEIATSNPDIYNELKVGQALKIPAKAESIDEDDRYIYHIVKRKETIYSITKKYNISQEALLALNPVIKDGLKKSQVVLIPKVQTTNNLVHVPDTIDFILHEVQKSEGLLAISRRYNVSTRDIELFNRDVLVDGVKLGTKLRIPVKKVITEPEISDHEVIALDHEVEKPEVVCNNTYYYDGRPFNISLFLPFTQVSQNELNSVEELDQDVTESKVRRKTSQTTQSALEFYEGFLLAADSAKRTGVSLNISVFDTKKQPVEVNSILNSDKFSAPDLLISPFFIDEILPIAKYAINNRVNMISPSYNGPSQMPSGNNIITVNQSFKEQFEAFINSLRLNDSVNYLIIYDKADNYSSSQIFCDSIVKLKFASSNVTPRFYRHRQGCNSLVAQDSMFLGIDSLGHNVIIVPSEDEPFVSEILSNIYGVKNTHYISTEVYGSARWRRMKNISPEYLYNLNLYIFTPFFVDYNQHDVQKFVADYREMYRAEPSQLSFLGYDIGLYFIAALKKFGPQFNDCLPTFKMSGLQIDFSFKKDRKNQNLRNTDQIIVKYTNGFDIVRAQ